MKVLITGISGRVGSTLAQELVSRGYEVRGTVRKPADPAVLSVPPEVELFEGDLFNQAALVRAVDGVDAVVHLAAQMLVGDDPVDRYFDVNVLGTVRLLEAVARRGRPLDRFVFASTDGVYGPARPQAPILAEDHPREPGDFYGTAKVMCETLVGRYSEMWKIPHVVLRLASVIGPGEALGLFRLEWFRAFAAIQANDDRRGNLWQLFEGVQDPLGPIETIGAGSCGNPALSVRGPAGEPWSLHLTDVRDTVHGILLSLERHEALYESFNIAGATTTSFSEGAHILGKRLNLEVLDLTMPTTLSFTLAIDKARALLGYDPVHDFESMVETAPVAKPAG